MKKRLLKWTDEMQAEAPMNADKFKNNFIEAIYLLL